MTHLGRQDDCRDDGHGDPRGGRRAAQCRDHPRPGGPGPTDDAGAAWYVRSIQRAAARTQCWPSGHQMTGPQIAPPSADKIADRLAGLALDPAVHGVICPTPLPPGVGPPGRGLRDPRRQGALNGANPASLGGLAAGLAGVFAPATAAAVLAILRHERVPLIGRRAVVVGRSTVVGKPAALLLLAEHATSHLARSRTRDLQAVCREADVLVAAEGQPETDWGGARPPRCRGDRRGHPSPTGWRRRGRGCQRRHRNRDRLGAPPRCRAASARSPPPVLVRHHPCGPRQGRSIPIR